MGRGEMKLEFLWWNFLWQVFRQEKPLQLQPFPNIGTCQHLRQMVSQKLFQLSFCALCSVSSLRVSSYSMSSFVNPIKARRFVGGGLSRCHPFAALMTTRQLTFNIHLVGKKSGLEPFIAEGILEYERRLTSSTRVLTFFHKSDDELVETVAKIRGPIFALDENGIQYSSRDFSKAIFKAYEDGGSYLTFVIGGFAGLPPEIRHSQSCQFVSLSRLTWTHEMARLLLMEQIYRSFEIRKNSKYHKD